MEQGGRWTAGRVIAAIVVWTVIATGFWTLIAAALSLMAVARWDWEAATRHFLRGVYGGLTIATVVLVGRCLYFHTRDGRGSVG